MKNPLTMTLLKSLALHKATLLCELFEVHQKIFFQIRMIRHFFIVQLLLCKTFKIVWVENIISRPLL
jgi:hypothetical protein